MINALLNAILEALSKHKRRMLDSIVNRPLNRP
jgi:hypothetical protein